MSVPQEKDLNNLGWGWGGGEGGETEKEDD